MSGLARGGRAFRAVPREHAYRLAGTHLRPGHGTAPGGGSRTALPRGRRVSRSRRSPTVSVARRRRSRRTSNAPRGALLYPRRSREGLGGGSLGLMAYRDPKGERDKRMPEKRRSSPGVRGGASRDPRDMAKAGLPDIPIPRRRKGQSAGKTPETGAMLCGGIVEGSPQPPERGALPSEGNQGDEWDAYVVLGRMTGTNAGSPAGREPHGDGVPIVVVRFTPHQGGRESRPQGEGAQVTGHPRTGRYA